MQQVDLFPVPQLCRNTPGKEFVSTKAPSDISPYCQSSIYWFWKITPLSHQFKYKSSNVVLMQTFVNSSHHLKLLKNSCILYDCALITFFYFWVWFGLTTQIKSDFFWYCLRIGIGIGDRGGFCGKVLLSPYHERNMRFKSLFCSPNFWFVSIDRWESFETNLRCRPLLKI